MQKFDMGAHSFPKHDEDFFATSEFLESANDEFIELPCLERAIPVADVLHKKDLVEEFLYGYETDGKRTEFVRALESQSFFRIFELWKTEGVIEQELRAVLNLFMRVSSGDRRLFIALKHSLPQIWEVMVEAGVANDSKLSINYSFLRYGEGKNFDFLALFDSVPRRQVIDPTQAADLASSSVLEGDEQWVISDWIQEAWSSVDVPQKQLDSVTMLLPQVMFDLVFFGQDITHTQVTRRNQLRGIRALEAHDPMGLIFAVEEGRVGAELVDWEHLFIENPKLVQRFPQYVTQETREAAAESLFSADEVDSIWAKLEEVALTVPGASMMMKEKAAEALLSSSQDIEYSTMLGYFRLNPAFQELFVQRNGPYFVGLLEHIQQNSTALRQFKKFWEAMQQEKAFSRINEEGLEKALAKIHQVYVVDDFFEFADDCVFMFWLGTLRDLDVTPEIFFYYVPYNARKLIKDDDVRLQIFFTFIKEKYGYQLSFLDELLSFIPRERQTSSWISSYSDTLLGKAADLLADPVMLAQCETWDEGNFTHNIAAYLQAYENSPRVEMAQEARRLLLQSPVLLRELVPSSFGYAGSKQEFNRFIETIGEDFEIFLDAMESGWAVVLVLLYPKIGEAKRVEYFEMLRQKFPELQQLASLKEARELFNLPNLYPPSRFNPRVIALYRSIGRERLIRVCQWASSEVISGLVTLEELAILGAALVQLSPENVAFYKKSRELKTLGLHEYLKTGIIPDFTKIQEGLLAHTGKLEELYCEKFNFHPTVEELAADPEKLLHCGLLSWLLEKYSLSADEFFETADFIYSFKPTYGYVPEEGEQKDMFEAIEYLVDHGLWGSMLMTAHKHKEDLAELFASVMVLDFNPIDFLSNSLVNIEKQVELFRKHGGSLRSPLPESRRLAKIAVSSISMTDQVIVEARSHPRSEETLALLEESIVKSLEVAFDSPVAERVAASERNVQLLEEILVDPSAFTFPTGTKVHASEAGSLLHILDSANLSGECLQGVVGYVDGFPGYVDMQLLGGRVSASLSELAKGSQLYSGTTPDLLVLLYDQSMPTLDSDATGYADYTVMAGGVPNVYLNCILLSPLVFDAHVMNELEKPVLEREKFKKDVLEAQARARLFVPVLFTDTKQLLFTKDEFDAAVAEQVAFDSCEDFAADTEAAIDYIRDRLMFEFKSTDEYRVFAELLEHLSEVTESVKQVVESVPWLAALSDKNKNLLLVASLLHDVGKLNYSLQEIGNAAVASKLLDGIFDLTYEDRKTILFLIANDELLGEILKGIELNETGEVVEMSAHARKLWERFIGWSDLEAGKPIPEVLLMLLALHQVDARARDASVWQSWRVPEKLTALGLPVV